MKRKRRAGPVEDPGSCASGSSVADGSARRAGRPGVAPGGFLFILLFWQWGKMAGVMGVIIAPALSSSGVRDGR
jgi:hypothetical protein